MPHTHPTYIVHVEIAEYDLEGRKVGSTYGSCQVIEAPQVKDFEQAAAIAANIAAKPRQ